MLRSYVPQSPRGGRLFGDRSDSISRTDSTTFLNFWLEAKASNDSVTGNENYVLNEKWVNDLMLRFMRYGKDSLNVQELEQLQTLAHSCPAVEGLGVFYARFLNSFFEPLVDYDDYQLCNGSQKGGGGLFNDLLNFLSESTEAESNKKVLLDGLKLFPVPADKILNIVPDFDLKQDARFELFDIAGKLLFASNISHTEESYRISTANLSPGIYYYHFYCSEISFCGLLSVQH